MPRKAHRDRRGGAAVELAVLLPFLAFLFVIACDWGRIFYYSVTVTNCARNGAIYGHDPHSGVTSTFRTAEEAALADAGNLQPAPEVTVVKGSDGDGEYNECTVVYQFTTLTNFPLVPRTTTLKRIVRVYVARKTPR